MVSAVAAAISAVGGAFAAVAAFRSATSARDAQKSADEAQRRMALRDLAVVAGDALVEATQCEVRAESAVRSHKDLAIFNNTLGGSRQKLAEDSLQKKIARAQAVANDAKLFIGGAAGFAIASLDEIDRVHTRLRGSLSEVRALREDIEHEQAAVDAKSAEHRESMLRAKFAK